MSPSPGEKELEHELKKKNQFLARPTTYFCGLFWNVYY